MAHLQKSPGPSTTPASTTITIRPSQTLPEHNHSCGTISQEDLRIEFKHPAYPEDQNVFLTLTAPDGALEQKGGGLHHETARIACGIISGNRWDGYLARTPIGPPITVEPDGLLRESEYYFLLPHQDLVSDAEGEHVAQGSAPTQVGTSPIYKYPLVPCFREWRFPHHAMPPSWKKDESSTTPSTALGPALSNTSNVLRLRDGSCRVSARETACDMAHLCPKNEESWFARNGMRRYTRDISKAGYEAINDSNNMLLLRTDLHRTFDNGGFTFVPKAGEIITHILKPNWELRLLYHNTKLLPTSVPSEYLLARFAYTIFPSLEGFLLCEGKEKLLLLADKSQSKASADECWKYTKQAMRSRSSSPKKNASPKKRSWHESQNDSELSSSGGHSHERWKRQRRISRFRSQCSTKTQTSNAPQTPSTLDSLTLPCRQPGDDLRIQSLSAAYLAEERLRSDPLGSWAKEQEWLRYSEKECLEPKDIRRMWRAQGLDVEED